MARYRIGTVGYLNSEPLTSYLDPEKYEVVADHPRGIASRLARGDAMLALSPVAAVLSMARSVLRPAGASVRMALWRRCCWWLRPRPRRGRRWHWMARAAPA